MPLFSVSEDAMQTEGQGLVYSCRVWLERDTLLIDGREMLLSPGMAATVEIKTGKRRVIDYFLSPLMEYGSESIRER